MRKTKNRRLTNNHVVAADRQISELEGRPSAAPDSPNEDAPSAPPARTAALSDANGPVKATWICGRMVVGPAVLPTPHDWLMWVAEGRVEWVGFVPVSYSTVEGARV